jgi:D-3-phosphoglycerate dehydrogenase
MMKWKVLVSAPYLQPVLEEYRDQLESRGAELLVPNVNERLSEDELLQLVGDIDGVIAGDDQFTLRVLEKAAPRLKVISKWGTGIDAFDKGACERFGVAIRNTPGAFTEPVADSVMGYILNFARKLWLMDQQMKAGVWEKIPGKALNETTLGIIGLGNIGTALAKRASAFGMKVIANDIRTIPEAIIRETGVQMAGLEELLGSSDFVSLNCDLNPTSLHLMDSKAFERMQTHAVLINLARGPLIKEDCLIEALLNRKIAGAALDVFEQEPLPGASPLKTMSNVMLAPHNSNSSPTAWLRIHDNTIKNLFEVLETES